jgi:hypothetical protein
VCRKRRLLFLRELSGGALVQRGVSAARCPRRAQILFRDHSDGGVERALHRRLEQQRHLDHRGPRRRREAS